MESVVEGNSILQFKITLQEVEPLIWRRIQVLDSYSFWDLHVAIQDVMGWEDCHLHQFEIMSSSMGKQYIGTPYNDDFYMLNTLSGWEHKVIDYLHDNERFMYEYHFKDGWKHLIEYEGQQEKLPGYSYPICVDGKCACPPEDIGGVRGYAAFLAVINDPNHVAHQAMLRYAGGAFDPETFDPSQVKFSNPLERWRVAFSEDAQVETIM